MEPIYKPNSVSRNVGTVIIHLVPTSRSGSRDLPAPSAYTALPALLRHSRPNGLDGRTGGRQTGSDASNISELLDLAPDGVYPASDVATGTGGLLHHLFTLIPTSRDGLLSAALAVSRHLLMSGPLPLGGILLCGVRTFLPDLPVPQGLRGAGKLRRSPDRLHCQKSTKLS